MLSHLCEVTWTVFIVQMFSWHQIQALGNQHQDHTADFCESETFEARCSENEAILMTTAKYGRMEIGRCITQSYGHIGCNVDVLDVLDSFCSGRKSCIVGASHPALLKKKKLSCPKDFAVYLIASYRCIKVQNTNCAQGQQKTITDNEGFVAPGPQKSDCPMIIQPSGGRLVNITMLSFLPSPASNQALTTSSACYEIGTINEKGKVHTIHKCLNDPRHKRITVTNGDKAEIKITSPQTLDTAGAFLLQYSVFGCNDPELPKGAKSLRNGNTIKVTCESSEISWDLICEKDDWVGEPGTCSTGFFSEDGWSFLGLFDHSHPYGTAIVVGIGATLGVLIGGILLYIIVAIFRRCQREEYRNYEYTDNNFTHVPVDFHGDKTDLVFNDGNNSQFGTWGPRSTLGRTDHSRIPLPPLPKGNDTLSYEKPLINRNGSEGNNIL